MEGRDYEVREKVSSEDRSVGKLIDISADGSLVLYANPSMDNDKRVVFYMKQVYLLMILVMRGKTTLQLSIR